jgi:activator of HSP90 ATPase
VEIFVKTKTIRQVVTFNASPADVYDALMDSKKHSRFTGAAAKISPKVGGRISAYDGYIEGTNLELKPGKRIVQAWRSSEWPKDHWSEVSFILAKDGKGTRLTFKHSGVPEGDVKDKIKGWEDYYWQPMREMLEK